MERAHVTPDGAGLFGPVHTGNAVVIAGHETKDVVADELVLVVIYVVDARNVEANAREDRLPARDRVRPHYRVGRGEFKILVQRRSARRHHLIPSRRARRFEYGLRARRSQRLHVRPERRGHPVVAGGRMTVRLKAKKKSETF